MLSEPVKNIIYVCLCKKLSSNIMFSLYLFIYTKKKLDKQFKSSPYFILISHDNITIVSYDNITI